MPSTTTTSLTIGSIFDLITPGAPASPTPADSGGFDSLLQTPPAPLPPPTADQAAPNPPPRVDQSQRSPAAAESASGDTHLSQDESQSDETSHRPVAQNTPKDQPPSPAPTAQANAPPATSKQRPETDQVDAQSLAGLAGVTPTTLKDSHPVPENGVAEEVPGDHDKAVAGTRPVPPGNQQIALMTGPATPKAATPANEPADSPAKTVVERPDASAPAHAAPAVNNQTSAAKKSGPADGNTEKAADEKPVAVDPLVAQEAKDSAKPVEAAQSSTDGSPDHHRENAHSASEAAALNPEPTLTVTAADVALTGQPLIAPPPVAPLAAQTPLPDATPSASGTPSAESITAPLATGQRARLPADVLAPSTQNTTRRTNVEIDTTRLLTRVARAVTTAQERDGEVRLRLSPPELGSLRLDVRVQDGVLVAHVQTETDAARTAILDNLPALRDRLADQGVRIERFDVDLMQRQFGGMADQPGGRQQEPLPPEARVVLPPRASAVASSQTTTSSIPRPSSAAGGLNVIV
jgi:flagellar hook-length control protein FliK